MTSMFRRAGSPVLPEVLIPVVDGLVGVAAVAGGIGLARNGLGMPHEWLLATPFDSWVAPGVLLGVGVGGSQLAAAFLVATHDERGRSAAIGAGVVLAGWIVVQVMVLRRFHPMQPAMLLAGVGTALLAKRLPRRRPAGGSRR